MARGDSSLTRVAKAASTEQVDVDQPEAERHREHQHEHPAHAPVAQPEGDRERALAAQRGQQPQELGDGADHDRHRVDRDPVVLGHERHGDDQPEDDHDVPEHRHERRGAELPVRLEHRRHEAREAQQHDDREHDLGQLDGLVDQVLGQPRGEDRHDPGRGDDGDQRHQAEAHGDEADQPADQALRLLVAPLLLELGEHRHERRRHGGVGHQAAQQVRHLERDHEGVDRAPGPEEGRGQDLAGQPRDAADARPDGEDRRRAPEPARGGAAAPARAPGGRRAGHGWPLSRPVATIRRRPTDGGPPAWRTSSSRRSETGAR